MAETCCQGGDYHTISRKHVIYKFISGRRSGTPTIESNNLADSGETIKRIEAEEFYKVMPLSVYEQMI